MQPNIDQTRQGTGSDIPVSFLASNITGTQSVPVEVNGGLSVRDVADSIASLMALPDDVAWALRDDDSSAYLDDDLPIGSQIRPGSKLTIIPKTHLGGRRGSVS